MLHVMSFSHCLLRITHASCMLAMDGVTNLPPPKPTRTRCLCKHHMLLSTPSAAMQGGLIISKAGKGKEMPESQSLEQLCASASPEVHQGPG